MNSFFPNVIKSWNDIPHEFQRSESLSIFKKSIFNLIRPNPKSIFGIHNPLGLRHLFQLRVGLSPLKCHKNSHNFIDTPNDWCDCYCAPESTYHFVLKCPLYLIQRHKLILRVTNLLVNSEYPIITSDE